MRGTIAVIEIEGLIADGTTHLEHIREDAPQAVGRMAGPGEDPQAVRPPEEEFTLPDPLPGRGATSSLA